MPSRPHHRLLAAQLRKLVGDSGEVRAEHLPALLAAVSSAYEEADQHRELLERSITLTSDELGTHNRELRGRQARLRQLNAVVLDQARAIADAWTDLDALFRSMTAAVCGAMPVARAGIWLLDGHGQVLRLADAQGEGGAHSSGLELAARDYPRYFAAMAEQRIVAAHDAIGDPRTAEFADGYLRPLGITGMLDAGIRHGSTLLGVVCAEHVGPGRVWTEEEQAFVASIADLISLAVESDRRRQAEREVDRQRTFLRQIIDLSPNLIYAKDRECHFTMVNQAVADFFGTTVAELTGVVDPRVAVHGVPACRDLPALDQGREVFVPEEEMVNARGEVRVLQTTKRPIIEADGTIAQLLSVSTDITERKRAELERTELEASLRQAQRIESVGLLAGGIAHDFNNILTPIMANAEMGLMGLGAGQPLHEELSEILQAARAARDLVAQLLALSRKQLLELRPIDLGQEIERTSKMLTRLVPAHVDLHLELTPGLPAIRADRGQVQQVLVNLVVNACDAITGAGHVWIRTRSVDAPPRVVLEIADTGAGMSDATAAQIFDPFFTTKEAGRGTGLGLATVYGIVRQHGGQIRVASKLGAGTTFTIELPAVDSRPVRVTAPPVAASLGERRDETILVVEDESAVRSLVRRVLAAQGYHVLAAETPRQAIDLVTSHQGVIDLVLTDVVLPGMNGRALYERLSRELTCPVVYMSGHARDILGKGALDPGTEFLRKPFSVADLTAKVRQVLER